MFSKAMKTVGSIRVVNRKRGRRLNIIVYLTVGVLLLSTETEVPVKSHSLFILNDAVLIALSIDVKVILPIGNPQDIIRS